MEDPVLTAGSVVGGDPGYQVSLRKVAFYFECSTRRVDTATVSLSKTAGFMHCLWPGLTIKTGSPEVEANKLQRRRHPEVSWWRYIMPRMKR